MVEDRYYEYEDDESLDYGCTEVEEKFMKFLRDKFPEPFWNEFANVKQIDAECQSILNDLKEEYYLAGMKRQKKEDEEEVNEIINRASSVRDSKHCEYCIGSCSECDYYGYNMNDIDKGIHDYFYGEE